MSRFRLIEFRYPQPPDELVAARLLTRLGDAIDGLLEAAQKEGLAMTMSLREWSPKGPREKASTQTEQQVQRDSDASSESNAHGVKEAPPAVSETKARVLPGETLGEAHARLKATMVGEDAAAPDAPPESNTPAAMAALDATDRSLPAADAPMVGNGVEMRAVLVPPAAPGKRHRGGAGHAAEATP
jgi:hypothetical protein